ncbi:MAG: pyruvate dehydrogenase (acetyl-transferring), homodimeric type [Myxococcota bacterium]|nr:pyruvate dehydrogenase (acetyl-transferring), homodimeric type [Myxococcota bacterium]
MSGAKGRTGSSGSGVDDQDPVETQEWLDALDSVLERGGVERAHYLVGRLVRRARRKGAYLPYSANTAYVNSIPESAQAPRPGDPGLEHRVRSIIRWNAMAMVVQANRVDSSLGGHISSFASAATLYDVGFNHFFHGPGEGHEGDLLYIQGHSAPGIYARAFLEGRVSEEQLLHFRREVDGRGLSSYPHPRLMPDFWQFPTVSMGLGPLTAIYQARFMKYLQDRGVTQNEKRKVWAFLGDGETDEPESLGAISLAGREQLDNLIFVVNCNLQRLDGPVRGNGKIIQELEASFRGAGWRVIKLIWGSYWDPLLAKDKDGILRKRMEEAVDGEYQAYQVRGGAYTREHFFGKYPELREMVANMSDEDIWRLNRGGHDPAKVYAAYAEAVAHEGQPVVILAKTVKGYGTGEAGEGQNITHQIHDLHVAALKGFRDRFNIPVSDDAIAEAPFYKPEEDSPEIQYMRERRKKLGGYLPARRTDAAPLEIPELSTFQALLDGTADREISTTMAAVRLLQVLSRDPGIGQRLVPIVPDESRTFGMEAMFRRLAIYSSVGQLYEPVDSDQVSYYREEKNGQILQEGITEAGAFSSWLAAGTAYANHGVNMIPFYIYYSMFGFQRIGDLAWLAGDAGARGFLLGGTSGRTTLNGEGLQHQDGHSHVQAALIPNCVAYDPVYAYELAVIIQDGLRRMYADQENVFYYVTITNEKYAQPKMPEGVEEGILSGLYRVRESGGEGLRVQLFGSGAIFREVLAAASMLKEGYGISADVWSVTSFTELAREGIEVQRRNRMNPEKEPGRSYLERQLDGCAGPVIAATDYVRAYPEQIRPYLGRPYTVLGTDGWGRSDTREKLREFFEVDRRYVVVSSLKALADAGEIEASQVSEAIARYGLDPDKPDPRIS